MATDVLKEFLVAIGFQVNETSYKRQKELITAVERELIANDKAAKERDAADKARVAGQTLRAAEVAANLRMVGVAVAGFATLAVGALAAVTTAVKNGIGEFDRLAYISGRTGASVNNIKAIGYAFSQTGSSAEAAVQALENFAKARRANPGVDAVIRSYGVSTEGDSSEVLSNALDAITKRHPQYTAQQVAGILGISPDEVDHWIRYRKEIAQFEKQYKDLQRTFGVNGGEMARASTAISRALGEWSAVVEVLRDKLVSLFLPAIEAVAAKLTELLAFLTSEENVTAFVAYFDKPIAAIKVLVKWVGMLYDQFVRLFEYVRNSPIGKILAAINPGFLRDKILEGIIGGGEGGSGSGAGGGDNRSLYEKIMPKALGGKDAPTPGASKPLGKLAQNGNAQTIMAELKKAGYSDNAIAAIVGSMQTESSFNPKARNEVGGGHTGLWQWDRNRWPKIAKWIKDQGGDPFDAGWQTRAWIAEHNAKPGDPIYDSRRTQRGGEILRGNPTIDEAIHGVRESERFGPGEEGGRGANARRWLPHVQQNGKGGAAAPSPPTISPPTARPNMTPGGFNVDDYLKTQPMGSSSNTTNNSKSVSQNNPVTVNVQGASDPQATGTAVARAMGTVNDMSLRNVQTAIR